MAIQKPSHTFTKIHLKALRTNNFHILFALSFTVFINTFGFAQDLPKSGIQVESSTDNDSLNVSIGDALKPITSEKGQDSTLNDTVKPKPEMLTGPIKYIATDYTSFNNKEQKLYMYNEAEVYYEDMELKAGIIVIDYNTNTVFAKGIVDSTGLYTQAPIFKQADNEVKPDSIKFNTVTEKALIYNSNTQQGDIKIFAPITKKVNDSVIFLYKGRFTTAKDIENPEYYFQASKIKIVPGEKIVVGVTNMVIADVPTPLGLPFGFFPLTNKQTSGVIIPTFGEESNRGYFIQNGGYYFALSDYFDLAVLGDYYTNGSYGLRMESAYANKYKFRGNLGFRYENLINSERGFPDYGKSNIYNIRWSHAQDPKANPNSRFSASVNLGSSKYYQTSINQVNAPSFLNNTLASSVSYAKTFQGEPQVNLSATATHSQNTNTEVINMTLPTVQASVSRIFPFAPKEGIKKGIIQNVNFQYNVRAENRIETTDSLFFKKEMWDSAENGMQHSIPLTTNFKVFKYLSLSASTSYDETWVFETVNKYYDPDEKKVVTETEKGFDAFRTYNFSTSLGTTVYGMFDFRKAGKDPKIQQIRHVMRPSMSYNINPSFSNYYQTYEVVSADGLTVTEEEYTRFEGGIFGVPNNRYSSSIGMSLSNNIEAKVRDRDSTATEAKKIKLLDNLNFSTAYNLAGDSLNWSPLRMSGGTQILNNKMSINFGATLDPYALDNNNAKIDKFNIDNGGSLFRLTSANVTMSYSISSSDFDGTENDRSTAENLRSGGRDDDLFGRAQDFSDQSYYDNEDDDKERKPSKLYTSKIPWNIKFAYAANYTNTRRENEISSHSLMFSGDVEIAPQWTFGASSGYDFKNNGFTYTQLRFERDLLSWRMNFSWVPFSTRSSWYFFIGIKSNILKDIKYDKRRQPDQRL
ncbi:MULTISPECIES: putative LPS assembly protein LptD [Bizionia]|uniref:LPS-assembly protein LptD n=1 Tax=Bizionia algoritergicola TaxID=291187 RepID=A0A5D0QX09_9FLAO|nr:MULTISPECIES: putative LPS assembly protein LptD [Bizionia]OBX21462.1 organic solvent tolerance protein OstA [Bizionia sp. APA-3]TYB73712.1 LPS-assembly protein LptD [Bizionia algoritergicola]